MGEPRSQASAPPSLPAIAGGARKPLLFPPFAKSCGFRSHPTALKVVLGAILACVILFTGATVTATVVVVRQGMIAVSVQEKKPDGDHVRLYVPAALPNLGMGLASLFVPDDAWGDARDDLARWRPAAEALAREIRRCPEGPLVEVRDRDETVRVALEGGALRIDVDNPEETVHLSVPISVMESAVTLLPRTPAPSPSAL